MEKNKILVIFTGGTIGSTKTEQIIAPDTMTSFDLINRYQQLQPHDIPTFVTRQPLCILSENMIPGDWLILARSLHDANHYTGVIIAHGTDTLPHTATALSYLMSDLKVPVVITGSNYPLSDPRAEGTRNFSAAIDFIQNTKLPGVYVSFENNLGQSIIHLGDRLMQASVFTDSFSSLGEAYFGCMKNGQFYWHDHPYNLTRDSIHPVKPKISLKKAKFSNQLLYLRPQPGLEYSLFLQGRNKPLAILHDLYHSGTVCTNPSDSSLSIMRLIKRAQKLDIPVYLAPIRHNFGDLYLSARELRLAGALPLENMTVEAAWVKLMLAYGSLESDNEIVRFMRSTLLHEKLIYRVNQ
ncbi:MAG TPA: asparaginase domain-containing protein [Burkholderiales bacterium]|nr:asparaginase domain-containing protein [Burkholderiales bacterium]